ncbi:MAG: hypothetical protein HC880_18045 [Bacteroidia bacterium]|nr:hypothetical protein [Bacteroidia bacterium]
MQLQEYGNRTGFRTFAMLFEVQNRHPHKALEKLVLQIHLLDKNNQLIAQHSDFEVCYVMSPNADIVLGSGNRTTKNLYTEIKETVSENSIDHIEVHVKEIAWSSLNGAIP